MKRAPRVSVVLANWNGARFLDEAVRSVVAQRYADWELIAVDTGSTDGSEEVLERWARAERRVRVVRRRERWPLPRALNLGLGEARGDYIARIESDDRWLPERLAVQVAWLERPEAAAVGVCGSDVWLMDERGEVYGRKVFPRTHEACLRAMWYRCPFCHSSVLMRREAIERAGGYGEAYTPVEDLELWFRLGRQCRLGNVAEPLVCYRVWDGALSTRRMRAVVWQSLRVRWVAAARLGYQMPAAARVYGVLGLAAWALPGRWVRLWFDAGLRMWTGEDAKPGDGAACTSAQPEAGNGELSSGTGEAGSKHRTHCLAAPGH